MVTRCSAQSPIRPADQDRAEWPARHDDRRIRAPIPIGPANPECPADRAQAELRKSWSTGFVIRAVPGRADTRPHTGRIRFRRQRGQGPSGREDPDPGTS